MMNESAAKYARIEYERKFLVAPESDWRRFVEPYSKRHEDKYLTGTRLRLRILTDSETGREVIKLTKKYESESPFFRPIVTTVLTREEYTIFEALEGRRVSKVRYYHHYKNKVFSIDVFENELKGLIICETEAPTLEDLMRAEPPPCAAREVTEDAFFTGANLADVSAAQLSAKLFSLE